MSAELQQRINDPRWRIANLYRVRKEGGGAEPIQFVPRDVQWLIIDELLNHPLTPLYIIKSRRLGASTGIGVAMTDFAVWTSGVNCNLVDQTQPDAWKKSQEIIQTAIGSLELSLPEAFHCVDWSHKLDSHLQWRWKGQPEGASRNIYCGMNARGGDCSWLWISESGPIAASGNQSQWNKIRNGALPSARAGRQIHETTWMGGMAGGMWEIIAPIYKLGTKWQQTKQMPWGNLELPHEVARSSLGTILFFPWWGDPMCARFDAGMDLTDVRDYFRDLEGKLGRSFSRDQRAFYHFQRTQQGDKILQEFPSTLVEALSMPGKFPRFDTRGIDKLEQRVKDALEPEYGVLVKQEGAMRPVWVRTDKESGWLRVWRHPVAGHRYNLPADLSTDRFQPLGADYDHHAVGIINAGGKDETGAIVPPAVDAAIQLEDRCDLGILAERISLMASYWGDCPVIPEINKHEGFVHLLSLAKVKNIHRRPIHVDDPAKGKGQTRWEIGWETTAASKPVIIDSLATAIREHGLIIRCNGMLNELRMFQQNNRALLGHHDDWVMMLAIGIHNLATAMVYRELLIQLPNEVLPFGFGATPKRPLIPGHGI